MDVIEKTIDAEALMSRVEQLIDQGRPGAARPLLAAVRGLMHPCSGLSVLAARLALSDGRLENAASELDQALAAEPDHPGLRKCRAELRCRVDDLDGAVRDAAEAVVLDRGDPAAKALLGELLLRLGRCADAAACLAEAVAARPADIAWRELLAQAHAAGGDVEGALWTLRDGIALMPGAAVLRNAAIVLCIRRRDFIQAADLAEQARIAGAADASTFALKGHALSSLSRYQEATRAYDDALKLAPDDAAIRHLATATAGAPEDYLRALFDGFADRFESHLIALGYRIPGLIRRYVAEFAETVAIGPVLDLGCGTGLMALALSDLALGPITGIDLSARMLDQARGKALYGALREARLPDALRDDTTLWGLIVAADLMCYFEALPEMLDAVRARLRPGGLFIFSVEELLPNHDGTVPGNGAWAPARLGRYAHGLNYVAAAAETSGFRCLAMDRETLRHEAGGPLPGLIVVLERPWEDA